MSNTMKPVLFVKQEENDVRGFTGVATLVEVMPGKHVMVCAGTMEELEEAYKSFHKKWPFNSKLCGPVLVVQPDGFSYEMDEPEPIEPPPTQPAASDPIDGEADWEKDDTAEVVPSPAHDVDQQPTTPTTEEEDEI